MKYYRYLQNNEPTTDYYQIEKDVDWILKQLDTQKIKENDVVLCKSESIYGVFCQYLAQLRSGIIPVFFPYVYSNDRTSALEERLIKLLDVKGILKFGGKGEVSVVKVVGSGLPLKNTLFPSGTVMFLTSATTGTPKVVVKSREQLDHEVDRYVKRLAITERDILLPAMALDNSFGIGSCLLPALRTGAAVADPGLIHPKRIIQSSCRTKATIMLGSIFIHQQILNMYPRFSLDPGMRFSIATGGIMPQGLQKHFYQSFKVPLLLQYGSSETGGLALSESGDDCQVVGKPFDGVSFKVEPDAEGRPVIRVSTPATIGSYMTEQGLIPLPGDDYQTNDLGLIRPDGKLEVHGRRDDVVSIAGLKISLQFVSGVLKQFPGVLDVRLAVKEFVGMKELQCEFIAQGKIGEEELVGFCKEQLPMYQIPKRFRQVDRFEETYLGLKSWKNSMAMSDLCQEIS